MMWCAGAWGRCGAGDGGSGRPAAATAAAAAAGGWGEAGPDSDDPTMSYMLQAWARLCRSVLGGALQVSTQGALQVSAQGGSLQVSLVRGSGQY